MKRINMELNVTLLWLRGLLISYACLKSLEPVQFENGLWNCVTMGGGELYDTCMCLHVTGAGGSALD